MTKHTATIPFDRFFLFRTETLRMYGPIFQLMRKASNDYKIPDSKLVIRKGTLILIPTYSIHMDPDNYPQPEIFDPERFSDENKETRHPMAFIPFVIF